MNIGLRIVGSKRPKGHRSGLFPVYGSFLFYRVNPIRPGLRKDVYMDLHELANKARVRDLSDPGALSDYFEVLRLLEKEDFKTAHEMNKEVRSAAGRFAREQNNARHFELYKKGLLFDAPHEYDSYLQYLEWNRKPEERFYLPRRRIMKRVADAMQRLVDDELDELFLSMPPRVGKTTMLAVKCSRV